MEIAVNAAGWVVGKALAPVKGGLLEAWAASEGLGPNVDELKVELLYAQAMLNNARGREIDNPALNDLLQKLRQLAYDADDVLDELDYFRIQDELEGTNHTTDVHAGGCVRGLVLNAHHTARAVAAKFKPSSSGSRDMIRGDPDKQDDNAKQGCLPSVCTCGGRTVGSSPPSPTNQDDRKVYGVGKHILQCLYLPSADDYAHSDMCEDPNTTGNGRQFFCGALPSKVQGCLSGACMSAKREMSSSPPSPANQCNEKVGCGFLLKATSTACDTDWSIGKRFPCCSFQSVDENAQNEKRFLCGAWTSKAQQRKNTAQQAPKLKFNRVEISTKMINIIKHLKPVCAKVSNILNLEFMGTTRIPNKDIIAMKRTITTSDITESEHFYGRDTKKERIVGIIQGEYVANKLTVLPIVGPGGIGKTTFTQHIYEEVQNHFQVPIWICVSLKFNANKLKQEAVKKIPKVDGEKENSSDQELIEQRLKDKRFLLVLDDMWACDEYEWKKLLAPFRKGGQKGNMVIITTRIPEVAKMVNPSVDCWIELERLQDDDFMRLFEACVFGSQQSWKDHTELLDVGRDIVSKLKGFPLEAKTVGRLLSNQLTLDHWARVLESKEWELQTNKDDIMPALKISYDYLPFHLQQCFYYCALFPEDYEFNSKELVHLWIGLDIVHPSDLKRRIEDVGLSYLNDLVNHGFFKKNEGNDGCPYYVVHDLLHDLAVNISSFECLSIHSSNLKSMQIPQDVRHLSIIVDNKDVEDIKTFRYYKSDLSALEKRLKVENLRTLMLFGEHHGSFAKTFGHLFEEARALRTIYLSGASYIVEDMLCNFLKLVHLRYIRIKSKYSEDKCLLSALSRLYHLEVIDLQEWEGCSGLARHISNLVKLRHFFVPERELQLHSNIVEVGKLKLLQELRSFEVGKESKGFELSQLGNLSELGGSLAIGNIERIQAMEEASEAKLIRKNHLHKLTLEWDANQPKMDIAHEENALEILIPHDNLQDLCIRGHGGTKCPQWLGENLAVKNLESLHLDGVAWKTFPPIGELWLVNKPHEEISSNVSDTKFQNLRRLELVKLPSFKKWVVDAPCQLFACLEVLIIKGCSDLTKLLFSHSTCCQHQKEANINWFHRLRELEIEECAKLLSFPPVPWTSAKCSIKIQGVCSSFKKLVCKENYMSEYSLEIEGKDDPNSMFWNVLVFDNLSELEELKIDKCPPLPLHHFQILSSLKILELYGSSIVFPLVEDERRAKYLFLIECITIQRWGASAKKLTQLLTFLPKLSKLTVRNCEKITGLSVEEQQATATPTSGASSSGNKVEHEIEQHTARGEKKIVTPAEGIRPAEEGIGVVDKKNKTEAPLQPPSSPINEMEDVQIGKQQQDAREEEEIATAATTEGLLLLPPQLQTLHIWDCPNLVLCPDSLGEDKSGGGEGGGLQPLRSLRSLTIWDCPRFLSSYSPSPTSSRFPFPNSLEELTLDGALGTSLLPLSNLTSLTSLSLFRCGDLRGEGLGRLLTHGHLTDLKVYRTPNFFVDSEPSQLHEQELPPPSSKLQWLHTDDAAGVLAAPICTLLSSSLTQLEFEYNETVERFTKEQEEALQLLNSLKAISFWECGKLQCLPAGLYRLPNLKTLFIWNCAALRSLPRDDLPPSSLQELVIHDCPAIRSLPKECLPSSLQELMISSCPAIRSLPKVDDLPSSLRVLNVRGCENEELRRQCRKLIGTIPIVRA